MTKEPSPTPGALQLVFSDRGTPKPDRLNAYDELRLKWVDGGMPAEAIRYIHDAKTDPLWLTSTTWCPRAIAPGNSPTVRVLSVTPRSSTGMTTRVSGRRHRVPGYSGARARAGVGIWSRKFCPEGG